MAEKKEHPYWKKFTDLNEAYRFLTLLPTESIRLFTDKSFKGYIRYKIFAYFREVGPDDIKNYNTQEHKEAVIREIFDYIDNFFFHSESKNLQFCYFRYSYNHDVAIPSKDIKKLVQISEFTAQYKQLVKLIGNGPDKYQKNYMVERLIEREFWKSIKSQFLNPETEDEEDVDDDNYDWDDEEDDEIDDNEYDDETEW